jgi:hypothetical protein
MGGPTENSRHLGKFVYTTFLYILPIDPPLPLCYTHHRGQHEAQLGENSMGRIGLKGAKGRKLKGSRKKSASKKVTRRITQSEAADRFAAKADKEFRKADYNESLGLYEKGTKHGVKALEADKKARQNKRLARTPSKKKAAKRGKYAKR